MDVFPGDSHFSIRLIDTDGVVGEAFYDEFKLSNSVLKINSTIHRNFQFPISTQSFNYILSVSGYRGGLQGPSSM